MSAVAVSQEKELSFEDAQIWKSLRKKVKETAPSVRTFFEMLGEIKDRRLYRKDFDRFADYLRLEVKLYSKSWVYQGIADAKTKKLIATIVPQAGREAVESLGTRTLTKFREVPEEKQKEVLDRAIEISPKESPLAKLIAAIDAVCKDEDDESELEGEELDVIHEDIEPETIEAAEADSVEAYLIDSDDEHDFEVLVEAVESVGSSVVAIKFIFEHLCSPSEQAELRQLLA